MIHDWRPVYGVWRCARCGEDGGCNSAPSVGFECRQPSETHIYNLTVIIQGLDEALEKISKIPPSIKRDPAKKVDE